MKKRDLLILVAGIAIGVACPVIWTAIQYAQLASRGDSNSLKITLTIPEDASSTDANKPDFHFAVTIMNVSNHPVSVWSRWCSRGEQNVKFFVDGEDGRSFSPPDELPGSYQGAWFADYPDPLVIDAGKFVIRDYYLARPGMVLSTNGHYRNYGSSSGHTFRMHVVLSIPPSALDRQYGVWTGTVSSPQSTFQLLGTDPYDTFQHFAVIYDPSFELSNDRYWLKIDRDYNGIEPKSK